MRSVLCLCVALAFQACTESDRFDIVVKGGRVIDPETSRDLVGDVGIRGGTIAAVSATPLRGDREIDARGHVVAPGFIDLHQHQHDLPSYRLKVLDGVTTALELETGVPDLREFVNARTGKAPIHFGATASHEAARVAAWGLPMPLSTQGPAAAIPDPPSGPVTNDAASPQQLATMLDRLRQQLAAGALGVGIGLEYTPGATRQEIIEVFRLAAEFGRPVYIHLRSAGRLEPGSSVESVGEAIAAAAITGAGTHIVHLNSTCLADSPACLAMIEGARTRRLDVTTEAYPYGAGMTFINSAFFNPGWRERRGIDYDALELPDSGERLTRERFETLHASSAPQLVLIHANPPEVVDAVIAHPLTMVASDGLPGHPRAAGTFARVLARHVRETRTLSLVDALRKMTILPARRLESATGAATKKGRLQEGADADIVVFDPASIRDEATFQEADAPSVGMRYVLVGGVVVVDDGHVVDGVYPGTPLVASADSETK